MYVVQQLVRQLVYTVFISNNHPLFHLWCRKNLVKYQKLPKYYDLHFPQNFLFLLIFLTTSSNVKSSHILAKKQLYLSEKTSETKLESLATPNLDVCEKFKKDDINKFLIFHLTQLLLFLVKIRWKALKSEILSKYSSLNGPGGSYKQKCVFIENFPLILSPKSFGNSWGTLNLPFVFVIIMPSPT